MNSEPAWKVTPFAGKGEISTQTEPIFGFHDMLVFGGVFSNYSQQPNMDI